METINLTDLLSRGRWWILQGSRNDDPSITVMARSDGSLLLSGMGEGGGPLVVTRANFCERFGWNGQYPYLQHMSTGTLYRWEG